MKTVLVNTGAGKDILYYRCFKAIGLGDSHLTPCRTQLEGFTEDTVTAKGTVTLKVTLGTRKCYRIEDITFLAIEIPSPYNAILGLPAQDKIEMLASLAH